MEQPPTLSGNEAPTLIALLLKIRPHDLPNLVYYMVCEDFNSWVSAFRIRTLALSPVEFSTSML